MDLADHLTDGNVEHWLAALPRYQQDAFRVFLTRGLTPEDAAREWLASTGPANTFPYGPRVAKNAFFDKLVQELEDFLCGDARYEEDRRKLLGEMKPGHTYLIASISTIIAPSVGSAAVLIAPAVAMLLYVVAKVGLNAWCGLRKDARQQEIRAKGDLTSA